MTNYSHLAIGSFLMFLASFTTKASAQSAVALDMENCWEIAGDRYQIDPILLYAIAEQESSLNPEAINARENDEDVGLMQINSFWYPHLESFNIEREDLFDPCTSILVGAYVLAISIQSFGYTWEAVGAYNAGTSKKNRAVKARAVYATSVRRRYDNIIKRMQP